MLKTTIIVAILNKNQGERLRLCLDSLLNQNLRTFEIVVVDGRSTDNSLQVLEEYAKQDKRIHFLIQRSEGTGPARNELIEYVLRHFPNVERLVWGDSENIYDSNYLSEIVNTDGDIVGGISVIDSSNPLSQCLWWHYNSWRGNWVAGNNCCVKAELYEKYQYLDIKRTEDLFFELQATRKGFEVARNLKAICYIQTVESFSELVRWIRMKIPNLWQGAEKAGMTLKLLRFYLMLVILMWGYVVLFAVFLFHFPFLLLPYVVPPLFLSFYLWRKGKAYVRKMRKMTFLYFLPIIFLRYSMFFFGLIGTKVSRRGG